MVSYTSEQAEHLLQRFVAAFNAGVRTGNFSTFTTFFTDDAVLDFEGIPERGPITGHDEIVAHYRDDPPDDEILVKRWKMNGTAIAAEFYWRDASEARGGCVFIEPRGDRIERLTIALGGPDCKFR